MERPPTKALDTGAGTWFLVDVVLRPAGPIADGDDARLVGVVAGALAPVAGPDHGRDPEVAFSYDIAPPEGELGVELWVRAATIGEAVDAATELVLRCAAEAGLGDASLWDVRTIPEDAVLGPRVWP